MDDVTLLIDGLGIPESTRWRDGRVLALQLGSGAGPVRDDERRAGLRLRARERAINHPFKHGNQGIGRDWVMNVGKALLPALRLQ